MSIKDLLMKPADLPYDYQQWKKLPFAEQAKKVCQAWAIQGFGSPIFAVIFYLLKIALYAWIWIVFCSYSTDLGSFANIDAWWFKLEALGKALLWTILLEVFGLGGASGPLTGRYMPIFGASLYYLRPGTIKSPLFPKVPILGNDQRNILDVLLYAALLYFLVVGCLATKITPGVVAPVLILLLVLGVIDKQIYLAARGDVWFPALFVFLFPSEAGGALRLLWFGVWFWAAFSKLTPNFTSVIGVMISNSPVLKFKWLKKLLFKDYPEDLRLSKSAIYVSHFGTLVEFSLPIILLLGTLLGWNQQIMFWALVGMTAFHTFIFVNFPMGVPMEWNVIMVLGAWSLFGVPQPFVISEVTSIPLIILLVVSIVILPIMGNLFPKYVSFLLSMRYYAGTWPFSIWLFKGDGKSQKLDPNVTKTSPDGIKQLQYFYEKDQSEGILSRIIAWRLMHLPSRVLQDILPKAVDDLGEYRWIDGEILGGEVLGWNFGDAHLHQETLLNSLQKRCNFASGELRVIMVESPQMHNGRIYWRIHDAHDGLLENGYAYLKQIKHRMPWPIWDNTPPKDPPTTTL